MFGFFMKDWIGLDCRVLTPCARGGSSSSGCPRNICVASLVFANFMVNKDDVFFTVCRLSRYREVETGFGMYACLPISGCFLSMFSFHK